MLLFVTVSFWINRLHSIWSWSTFFCFKLFRECFIWMKFTSTWGSTQLLFFHFFIHQLLIVIGVFPFRQFVRNIYVLVIFLGCFVWKRFQRSFWTFFNNKRSFLKFYLFVNERKRLPSKKTVLYDLINRYPLFLFKDEYFLEQINKFNRQIRIILVLRKVLFRYCGG